MYRPNYPALKYGRASTERRERRDERTPFARNSPLFLRDATRLSPRGTAFRSLYTLRDRRPKAFPPSRSNCRATPRGREQNKRPLRANETTIEGRRARARAFAFLIGDKRQDKRREKPSLVNLTRRPVGVYRISMSLFINYRAPATRVLRLRRGRQHREAPTEIPS